MGKSTHFIGPSLYSQVIKLLGKERILHLSRENGEERYIKCFNGLTHPVVMLYAVIMRFDSLREISTSPQAEARKLYHSGSVHSTYCIMAMDSAYIDYTKFKEMTRKGIVHVTKMKKNLKYKVLNNTIYQSTGDLMEVRIRDVTFTRHRRG